MSVGGQAQPAIGDSAGQLDTDGVPSTEPLRIGIPVADGAEGFFEGIGADVALGNQRNQFEALRDDINARGGIAGRELQLEFYAINVPTAAANPDQAEQEVCTYYTQDIAYVPVVVASGSPGLGECLAAGGIAMAHPYSLFTSWDYEPLRGFYFAPSHIFLDRFAQVYVDQLVALGFLTPDSVIGLLNSEAPASVRLSEEVLQPALARHGMQLAVEVSATFDGYIAQSNGFVLQMRAAGVTHILNLAAGANVFFMQSAEQQRYRPAYAITSNEGPQAWVALLAPPAQLESAVGIGWVPVNDVPLYSVDPVSSNETRCIDIMRNAGEDMNSGTVAVTAYRACEALFFLESAWNLSGTADVAGLQAGMEALAGNYPGVMALGNQFGANKPDGASHYRPLAFAADCSCFSYTGPPRPF